MKYSLIAETEMNGEPAKVIRSALAFTMKHFPENAAKLETLYRQNESFRSLCEDLRDCVDLFLPDLVQDSSDGIPLFPIEAIQFPYGVYIDSLKIATDASSSYSVNFEEWTAPDDGSPSTIETVATSSSLEAGDDGSIADPNIAVGSWVFVDLPDTHVKWLHVTVFFRAKAQ